MRGSVDNNNVIKRKQDRWTAAPLERPERVTGEGFLSVMRFRDSEIVLRAAATR